MMFLTGSNPLDIHMFLLRRMIRLALLVIGVAGACDVSEANMTTRALLPAPTRVALLGASIGKGWEFPSLPERTGIEGLTCEFAGIYDFDKGQALRELLARPRGRPDIIILKECAAYFPGDLNRYEGLMRGWIEDCRTLGVVPVPVTAIPVQSPRTLQGKLKLFVKQHVLHRETRNGQIARYNDWLREYTAASGLELLDLEAALRVSRTDRTLRGDLQSGDGLHVNNRAYAILDQAFSDILDRILDRRR
jgi:hypothetical protein